jgi:hypothetical protein
LILLVRVRCSTCKGLSQVEDKYLGGTVRCPRCKEQFVAAEVAESLGPEEFFAAAAANGPAALPAAASASQPALIFDREEKMRPLSLERVPWAWVDRILPAHPRPYLVAIVGIALGCWAIGYLLALDKGTFLAAHEWQVQPLFLATHFVCLRLFVTCYTRNFLAGAARMDLPEGEAVRHIKQMLGPTGGAAALLIAAPFWAYSYFVSLAKVNDPWAGEGLTAIKLFMLLIWCVEWLLNAYIWVLLVGFLVLTMRTLWWHRFRAPIEQMLHEKHYRPFLMMSAQGASIVLFFTAVNGFYVWYAQGDYSDYAGLAVTGLLLLLGFTPPWFQLKNNVEKAVNQEMFHLQEKLVKAMCRQADGAAPVTVADLSERLDSALAILRTSYLERMHRELGRAEGKAILLKLLAPLSTIAWKILRPMTLGG